jgi:hypothetical protein
MSGWPPLSARGQGSVLTRSVGRGRRQAASEKRLWPPETNEAEALERGSAWRWRRGRMTPPCRRWNAPLPAELPLSVE